MVWRRGWRLDGGDAQTDGGAGLTGLRSREARRCIPGAAARAEYVPDEVTKAPPVPSPNTVTLQLLICLCPNASHFPHFPSPSPSLPLPSRQPSIYLSRYPWEARGVEEKQREGGEERRIHTKEPLTFPGPLHLSITSSRPPLCSPPLPLVTPPARLPSPRRLPRCLPPR